MNINDIVEGKFYYVNLWASVCVVARVVAITDVGCIIRQPDCSMEYIEIPCDRVRVEAPPQVTKLKKSWFKW